MGITERFVAKRIVQQGGNFGPVLCSNSVDKLGKECLRKNENCYLYKEHVKIPPLGMMDDIIGVGKCGMDSLELNVYINTKIEMKKLSFHIPDAKGKSKCHILHVGRQKKNCCQTLKVHGHDIKESDAEEYLGDIVTNDGRNTKNIEGRVSKGIGISIKISNILKTINFGTFFFETALLLRNSAFINGLVTNIEAWNFKCKKCQNIGRFRFKTVCHNL